MSNERTLSTKRTRFDEWAVIYPAPTATPFELRPAGSVYRGMHDLDAAKQYADAVHEFWRTNGVEAPVFVVRGPTSTTSCSYEVVSARCGYSVVYQKGRLSEPGAEVAAPPEAPEYPRDRG